MTMAKRLALAAAIVIVSACSGDDDVTGLDSSSFELVTVSGDGQSGFAGSMLDEPLVVFVRSLVTGAGTAGVSIDWSVVGGSGAVTRMTSITDSDGQAVNRVVAGADPGALAVRANVRGLDPIIFRNLNVLPAPWVQAVLPTTVDPGDTVEVRVRDLPPGASVQVLFDGVLAAITDRQDGSLAILRTVVPAPAAACSGSEDVAVRVRVDGVISPPRDVAVRVPADPFQVGQVIVLEGTDDAGCALLPAAGGDARYLVVVMSAEFETDGFFDVWLSGTQANAGAAEPTLRSAEPTFDSLLRGYERDLMGRGLKPSPAPAGPRLFAGLEVGDQREFWMINNIDDLVQLNERDFDRVSATLKFVGGHTLIYIDDDTPAAGFSQDEIDALGELYDRVLYVSDADHFGEPTDIDGNGRVILLLSPMVNSLSPRGGAGVTVGFFFGLDLLPPGTANCPECAFSNVGELFYGLVPDPDGEFGDPRTMDRVMQLLPGVMAHETAHMINFRFKSLEQIAPRLEELWLSEGLAHMAEELAGDAADAAGYPDRAADLYTPNLTLAFAYLDDPAAGSLTAISGPGSISERGAAWLFLRWLAEQYGDYVFRDIAQAGQNGVFNIEAQTGESFFRLFADWAVTLWTDDLEIPGLAGRYQIPKWLLRSVMLKDGPEGGEPVYVLQPQQRGFADLRNTPFIGILPGSSPSFLELNAAGDTAALQLRLTANTQAGLAILRLE
jgi:hypothetical protein